ncbi:30S ribosomal protein S13 [Candidatus Woesearchaeota archaeon]|nr:30S ribosomal protein S13 [Candidatus Woesearchaeota archaeon]
MSEKQENYKHLIRVANTDLKGEKQILFALKKINGVGISFANAALSLAGVDKTKKAGHLTDAEAKKIEDVIINPQKNNVPSWMYNRRKDIETGDDIHILSGDLKFTSDQDKKRMQKTKSYKGLRLAAGLPVRGQRTKSNFRRGKGKGLGVKRKK